MRRCFSLLAVLPAAVVTVAVAAESPDLVADAVYKHLAAARDEAGLPPLTRRSRVDAVAKARAAAIAARPPARRLADAEPVELPLRKAGVRYRSLYLRVDLKRGHWDFGGAFAETWRVQATAWKKVLDPHLNSVGLGTALTDDGWVVFVAILLEERVGVPNLDRLEKQTIKAVNRAREAHGLRPLEPHAQLREVARAHSEEMARLKYFAHESPSGRGPADRIRARGITGQMVAENILSRSDDRDLVQVAVESWMDSPGHRRNMLDPAYTHTGVGIAMDDEGLFYFTQLFLLP